MEGIGPVRGCLTPVRHHGCLRNMSYTHSSTLRQMMAAMAALALFPAAAQADPSGKSTRYWDCCKPSGAWSGKASVSKPVNSCAANGVTVVGSGVQSGCNSGTASNSAFTCNNQQPWSVNSTLSYGYAAAAIAGSSESGWLCACYKLTFNSGTVSGKQMVVQVTNTGGDLSSNQFDLLIPGGGEGIFTQGCTAQWGVAAPGWGAQYGGISSDAQCSTLPSALQAGCHWRFQWFANANNPSFTFHRVKCPAAITANTGCIRADDSSQPTN